MTTRGIATRGIFAAKTFALVIVIDSESRYMFTDEFDTQWPELPQPVRDWYDTIGSFFFEVSNAIENICSESDILIDYDWNSRGRKN